jgi:hypothetical protein
MLRPFYTALVDVEALLHGPKGPFFHQKLTKNAWLRVHEPEIPRKETRSGFASRL